MVTNVTRLRTSHFQSAQDFFYLLTGPDPSYPVLKFGVNLSSRNWDMAQNVILYSCDPERSRSSVRSIIFCSAIRTLPMSIHVKFHWDPTRSFSGKLAHNLPKSGQEKERRKMNLRRNSLTDVDTLWRKLHHEGEIWRKSDHIWFEDLSLNFHLILVGSQYIEPL